MIKKFKYHLRKKINNLYLRREFVSQQLSMVSGTLLDAGCGSQQFRCFCDHLQYVGQDFAGYKEDEKERIDIHDPAVQNYAYGPLDIVSDIWDLPVEGGTYDAVLCTEVLEHVPYPRETIKELARVLKPGGTLILTAPSNCLRHMDPFYFSSGFSDRWFNHVFDEFNLEVKIMDPVGDYFSWMFVELYRTARNGSVGAMFLLLPAMLYYGLKQPTTASVNSLCMGWHIVAMKH